MALADDEEIGSGRPWRKSKLSVHDFNLRIPFLVLPGRRVPEARIPGPCSNVDFVPTLLDWLRIPPPRGLPGASLLRAIRGEETLPASRPIYARVSAFKGYSDCIVHRDRKYMRFFDLADGSVTARHTFDLRSDPREALSLGEDFGEAEPLIQKAAGVNGRAYVARVRRPLARAAAKAWSARLPTVGSTPGRTPSRASEGTRDRQETGADVRSPVTQGTILRAIVGRSSAPTLRLLLDRRHNAGVPPPDRHDHDSRPARRPGSSCVCAGRRIAGGSASPRQHLHRAWQRAALLVHLRLEL